MNIYLDRWWSALIVCAPVARAELIPLTDVIPVPVKDERIGIRLEVDPLVLEIVQSVMSQVSKSSVDPLVMETLSSVSSSMIHWVAKFSTLPEVPKLVTEGPILIRDW